LTPLVVVGNLTGISTRATTSSGVKEEIRVAMSLSSRGTTHHMSRRATGGLLQDGAAGNGRAVWHSQPLTWRP
jgi:hypothetical protein